MPSTYFFIAGTLLLSLNFLRPYGLAISDWLYFVALILALVETARFDRPNLACWTRNRFLWMAGLICLGAIISTARAIFVGTALVEIFQQLYVVTLFISLIWIMARRDKTDVIVKALVLSGFFTASITVVDYLAGTNFGPRLSGIPDVQLWYRYAGTLGHPNKLGYFLVITSILTLAKLFSNRPGRDTFVVRLFWGLLVCMQVFGLYLSGSLTAYLGFLLGVITFLASSKSIARRALSFMAPILYTGTLVFILTTIFGNLSLSKGTFQGFSLISSALDRVETTTALSRWVLYEQALGQIAENPIVGVGYDQISTSGIGFDFRALQGTVHNLLLQTWYVGGLFAFVGWFVIYFSLGRMAISILQKNQSSYIPPVHLGIAAVTLSILLMDQFQDSVYQREKWLVFGLLADLAWSKLISTSSDF